MTTSGRAPAPIDRRLLEPCLGPFRESYTLPGIAYTSPEPFAWEMSHLFDDSWTCPGRAEGMVAPNSRRAVQVGISSIVLTRDRAGILRAFFNICRHRGHELCHAVRPLTPDKLVESAP
jgi:glycine betaine catabolism A